MKKKWNILLYALAVVLIVGGLLALWLPNRNTEDTDPNAPFVDLSNHEKERVMEAIKEDLAQYPKPNIYLPLFWYGEQDPAQDPRLEEGGYRYGVRYYGTFGGYHIVLVPKRTETGDTWHGISIGGYEFRYIGLSFMYAYKDGVAVPLYEVYDNGQLSDEQLGKIYQCYEHYNEEIYIREEWIKNENNNKIMYTMYVCCAGVILMGAGACAFCYYRKRRAEDLLQCDNGK